MSGLCFWQRNPVTGGTADNRAFSHSPLVQLTDNSTCPKNDAFQKALARGCSYPAQNGFDTQRSKVCDYCELCALSSITAHSFASGTDMAYSQCIHSSLQSRNKSGGGHGVVEAVNKMTIATKSAKCFTVSSRNFKHVAAVKYLQWQKKKKKINEKSDIKERQKALAHLPQEGTKVYLTICQMTHGLQQFSSFTN